MKHSFKRVISLLLSVMMIISMLPTAALADDLTIDNVNVIEDVASVVEDPTTGDTTTDDSGNETTVEELVISSVTDLQAFAAAVNGGDKFAGKVVKLGADIDLSGIEWAPIGGENIYFAGEFDGQNYAIKNLTQTTGARMGLFGLVEKAYIHDLTLSNVNFTVAENNARVGALAGNLQYWNVIEDVTIDGINITVNGNDGLIGVVSGYAWKSQMGNVDVKNAVFTVNGTGNVLGGHTAYGRAHVWDTGVTGNNAHWLEGTVQTIDGVEYVLQNYFVDCDVNGIKMTLNGTGSEAGGFFGSDTYNSHSNYFVNCHVTGLDVTCAEGTSQTVGGFIAWNNGTTSAGTVKGFDGCSASGTITGADGIYGGFVGQVGGRKAEFTGASADVDITCTGTVGGFVGVTAAYSTHKYTFTNCSASGDVSGTVAGGFAGKNGLSGDGKSVYVDIIGCTATGKVNGTTYAGGLIGEVNPELPATNWNIVDSTGSLVLTGNKASANVTGDATVGYLIGYFDGVANGDAKEGNTIELKLESNTPDGSDIGPGTGHHINVSDDTITEDVSRTMAVLTFNYQGTQYSMVYNGEDGQTLQDLIGTNDYADFTNSQNWLLAYAAQAGQDPDLAVSDVVLTLYADLNEALILPNVYYQVAADYDITIDLNGYTFTNTTSKKTIETFVDTTIKNGTVKNEVKSGRAVDMRGDLDLVLTDVNLSADKTSAQALTVGGDVGENNRASVNMNNVSISAVNGYCVIVYNPVDMTVTDSDMLGYGGLYFKGADGSQGAAGSVVNVQNSELNTMVWSDEPSNHFATVVFEDDDITLNVNGGQLSAVAGFMGATTPQDVIGLFGHNDENKTPVTGIAVKVSADTSIIGNSISAIVSGNTEGNTITLPKAYNATLNTEGHKTKDNGDETVTIISYVEWIKAELLAGNDVKLDRDIVVDGSMIESIPAPTNGNGRYPNYAIFTVIGDEVTFDLNGHTITYNGHKDFQWNGKTYNSCTVAHGLFYANAGAHLTVKDGSAEQTGTVMVYGLASGAYVASPGTKFTIEGGTWKNVGCAECGGTNIFLYPLQGGELYIKGGHFDQALDSTGESYLIVEHGGEYKNSVIDYSKTKVEISGGTFVGMNPSEIKYFQQTADNKLDTTTKPTTDGCAEGFVGTKNDDGTYGVIVKTSVTIGSVADLIAFGNAVTGNTKYQGVKVAANPDVIVTLTADLDLAGSGFVPMGNGAGNAFSGTFDGQNHTISNMTLSCDYYRGVGFFRSLGKGAVVKNVTFVNANIDNGAASGANHFYGVVAGFSNNLTLDNVDVKDSSVTCKYAGAAYVGCLEGASTIKNCDVENFTLTTTSIRGSVFGILGNSATGHTAALENNTIKNAMFVVDGEVKELKETLGYGEWNTGAEYTEASYVAQISDTKYSTLSDAVAAATDGATITLIGDVVRAETLVVSKNVTIDFADCAIETIAGVNPAIRITNGANVTVKNATMDTESYCFILGASDGTSAGNLTIESGTFHGGTSVASVTKGTLSIKGGEFSVEPYQGSYDFLLNCIDANYKDGSAVIEVTGGTFANFNPANNAAEGTGTNFVADGYVAVENANGTYDVAPNMIFEMHLTDANGEAHWLSPMSSNDLNSIIEKSKIWYESLQGTYSFTLKILEDCTVKETVIANFPMTIDLNGKTITADGINPAIRITNGANVIVKNGTMVSEEGYCFILGASDGTSAGNLTIESGKFHGATTVASVTKGTLTINGGEFSVEPYEGSYGFLLNCVDANYANGSAKIVVTGGTFANFNPANNAAEGAGTSFVPEGYVAAEKTTGFWTVEKKVYATMTFEFLGVTETYTYPGKGDGGNELNSMQDLMTEYLSHRTVPSFFNPPTNTKITLNDDVALTEALVIGTDGPYGAVSAYELTIDLNGNALTGNIVLTDDGITLIASEGLTVTSGAEGYEVVYENGVYSLVAKTYVAQVNNEKFESIQAAVAAAKNGDTVTVIADHELTWDGETKVAGLPVLVAVDGKTVTIDLNGKKLTGTSGEKNLALYAAFAVDNDGSLTLKNSVGTGSVSITGASTMYSLLMAYEYGANNATKLIVEGGSYYLENAHDSMIFCGQGASDLVYIKGGNFKLGNVGTGENGKPWIFNVVGQVDGYANITGGTFNADVNRQFWAGEAVVAQTHYIADNGNGTWTVKEGAVAYVKTGMISGPHYTPKNIGYATFEEAIVAAVQFNDSPVTLLKNAEVSGQVGADVVVIDPNGYTITLTNADATLTHATDTLTVNTDVDGSKVIYEGGIYKVVKDVAKFDLYGASMTAGNDLKMEFYVEVAKLEGNTDVYASITKYNADGTTDSVKIPYSEWKTRTSSLKYVDYNGIAAKEMADTIEVQIFKNDGTAISTVWTDSVRDYAMRILTKNADNVELRTVMVDMLNYGAASQTYFKYNQDDLANNKLSETQQAWATQSVTYTDNRVKGSKYYGTALTAESNIIMTLYFTELTTDMKAVVTFTDHYGNEKKVEIDGSEFELRGDLFGVIVDEIVIADARQLVTCEIYDGDTLVASASDSVESYVARISATNPVYETIMKFAASAHNYFH